MENLFFGKTLNKTDTSLYFLTVRKVLVSLPTKFLRNPTSGSAVMGYYKLGPAHFLQRENINQRPSQADIIFLHDKYISRLICCLSNAKRCKVFGSNTFSI